MMVTYIRLLQGCVYLNETHTYFYFCALYKYSEKYDRSTPPKNCILLRYVLYVELIGYEKLFLNCIECYRYITKVFDLDVPRMQPEELFLVGGKILAQRLYILSNS